MNILYILFFKRWSEGYLSLKDADDKLSNFAAKNLNKGKKITK